MGLVALCVMATMVVCNGVFAGYELALAAVTAARLQVLAGENRAGSKAALYMKQNMEASLAAVQVAITLFGAIAAAIGGAEAAEELKPFFQEAFGLSSVAASVLAIALVVVPLTFMSILFGELIPKVFSLRNKEWVCLRLSPPMRLFCISVWPAVWLFEICVTTLIAWSERRWRPRLVSGGKLEAVELLELHAQAAQARASRLIGEREEGIIIGAAKFSSRTVREIMLPAEHITMLAADSSLADCLVAAHLEMHTRFPVAEKAGDPQSLVGYVNFKDLVAMLRMSRPGEASLRAIIRPLPSLGAEMKLTACLERMIREHTHIALVRNADWRVVGMITMEDILEELVGDIQDEYDRLPVHAIPSGWAWIVGGGLGLARLKDIAGIDLEADLPAQIPVEGLRNLSDWIIAHLGGRIRGGEVLQRPGLRVVVRKVRRQKVLEALIGRIEPPLADQPEKTDNIPQ